MQFRYVFMSPVTYIKPVSETETFVDAESETKVELLKLAFRKWLWTPTPDGVWERALEDAVRSLSEARAQADLWTNADEK